MNELFLKIVNMSISAGWLVLAVLILRLALKKAPKRFNILLWAIVAVRLICPFSFESALSLVPSAETIPDKILSGPSFQIQTGLTPVDDRVNDYLENRYFEGITVPTNHGFHLVTVFTAIWAAGVLLLAAYMLISYCRLYRRVSTAVRYRDNIFQSETADSPFVLGLLRPRIYLPFKMDGQDLEYVIAHERAHICRRDHWWKPLGFLLLTIHWFNPLIWTAYILLCRDIELACDEKVIAGLDSAQRADYTRSLVACSVRRPMTAVCPLAFGEVGVRERVKTVMNYKKPAFWIIALAVTGCTAVAVCFLTNPMTKQDSLKPNRTPAADIKKTEHTMPDDNMDEAVPHTVSEQKIAGLFDAIQSSPAYSSRVDDYIRAHEAEYQELLGYDEYTLRYCFANFLQGGQTGLRGHIMASACLDIGTTWGEAPLAADIYLPTGQDWFDAFKDNAEALAKQMSDTEIKKMYPASFLLLDMMRETL